MGLTQIACESPNHIGERAFLILRKNKVKSYSKVNHELGELMMC